MGKHKPESPVVEPVVEAEAEAGAAQEAPIQPESQEDAPPVTEPVSAPAQPAISGLAALERANAILSAIEAGEALTTLPGELGAIRASLSELVAQAKAPAPTPTAPTGTRTAVRVRTVMPADQRGPNGKQLVLMLYTEAVGPFLVGHNTPGGWRIRDTRTNTDHDDLYTWKSVKASKDAAFTEARARLAALNLSAEEVAALQATAAERICSDGTAR